MRHKLMGMMGVAQEIIHLHGRIELDETFIRTGHKSLTAEELGDNKERTF